MADCRPGAWVLALAGWICVAAGEPAALSLACSINSGGGGGGPDRSLTLISDSGADAQLLTAAHTTGGEERVGEGAGRHTDTKRRKTDMSHWE